MKRRKLTLFWVATAMIACATACDEEESPIGLGLQDPSTLYDGIHETIYLDAFTHPDDSMTTHYYSMPVIGSFKDEVFGQVTGSYFTQIGMTDDNGIIFDNNCIIDSVTLTFSVNEIYPNRPQRRHPYHFRVDQLTRSPLNDSTYYCFDQIPTNRTCFFDGYSPVKIVDSTLCFSLKLNNSSHTLFANKRYENNDAFTQETKGIRLRLLDEGENTMMALNLAASATKLTVYYRYVKSNDDTISQTRDFSVGMDVTHFNHFDHQYNRNLASLNCPKQDSIVGEHYLYFEPLGGTYVKLNLNNYIAQFHQNHPHAIIHYAEIILPVAKVPGNALPSKIIARYDKKEGSYIEDMIDSYTSTGFDGSYHADSKCYRLRITQHLQNAISTGKDTGTYLFLNTRRYSPRRVVINGTNPALTENNPSRIEFVYSEPQL